MTLRSPPTGCCRTIPSRGRRRIAILCETATPVVQAFQSVGDLKIIPWWSEIERAMSRAKRKYSSWCRCRRSHGLRVQIAPVFAEATIGFDARRASVRVRRIHRLRADRHIRRAALDCSTYPGSSQTPLPGLCRPSWTISPGTPETSADPAPRGDAAGVGRIDEDETRARFNKRLSPNPRRTLRAIAQHTVTLSPATAPVIHIDHDALHPRPIVTLAVIPRPELPCRCGLTVVKPDAAALSNCAGSQSLANR